MAGAERIKPAVSATTTRVDDPLVRALSGAEVDAPTPWFIRQARKISATDGVLPMRSPAVLKSVGSATDATRADDGFGLPEPADRAAALAGPTDTLFDTAPSTPARGVSPSTVRAWRYWPVAALIVAMIAVALLGWLRRDPIPVPQPMQERPRAAPVPAPVPRVLPTAPPVDRGAASSTPGVVAEGFTPSRAGSVVGAQAVVPSRGAVPRANAPLASDRRAAPTLAAPRPALTERVTPRDRAVPAAARCNGLGRGGAWLVCTRPRLAALDRVLERMSAQTLATGDPRAQRRLAKSSARFFARRDRCTSAPCVARLYERRLDAVSDYLRDGIKDAAKRATRRAAARGR